MNDIPFYVLGVSYALVFFLGATVGGAYVAIRASRDRSPGPDFERWIRGRRS